MMKKYMFILFLLIPALGFAQLKLPAIISDNMLLQQNENTAIWGWDTPGKQIKINAEWLDQELTTTSNNEGEWFISIPTLDPGECYSMEISGSNSIKINNITFGEVWLCSGQSNMEMPLQGWPNQPITGSEEAIASADNPEIRLFTVQRNTSLNPLDDCQGEWLICTPETVKNFSATAYFFGKEIQEKTKLPVGLIFSSWGGTPAEAWTPAKDLEKYEFFTNDEGLVDPTDHKNKLMEKHQLEVENWYKNILKEDHLSSANITEIQSISEDWGKIEVPSLWKNTSLGSTEGVVWFTREVKIPKKWLHRNLIVELGPIDEMDHTWFNETLIGKHSSPGDWQKNRKYTIPAELVDDRKNTLTIRVINTSGAGGIFGDRNQLKVYPEDKPEQTIKLAGSWNYKLDVVLKDVPAMPYCHNCEDCQLPTVLFNAMIQPLIPYHIKGAIWYQGESNRYNPDLYEEIFPNMILSWRNKWNIGAFPFYFVQIAPYTYRDDFDTGRLREAQLHALKTVNTGMAVTMDVGSLTTIHPPDKTSVGTRLALWALNKQYGMNVPYSGPLYKSHKIEHGEIIVDFYYAINGLKMQGEKLLHFTIAGNDGVFHPAQAKIQGNHVIISSPNVKNPAAARFGWGNTDQTNLFNTEGLPAAPFRTDHWE